MLASIDRLGAGGRGEEAKRLGVKLSLVANSLERLTYDAEEMLEEADLQWLDAPLTAEEETQFARTIPPDQPK